MHQHHARPTAGSRAASHPVCPGRNSRWYRRSASATKTSDSFATTSRAPASRDATWSDREPQRVFQPLSGHGVADIETDEGRQDRSERLAEVWIPREISADESRQMPPPPSMNRRRLREGPGGRCSRRGRGVPPVAVPVGVPVRHRDEIAGGEIDGITVVDFAPGAALAEQVIDDHVGPVPSEDRRERRGLGCQDTPGLREFAVQVPSPRRSSWREELPPAHPSRQSTTGLSAHPGQYARHRTGRRSGRRHSGCEKDMTMTSATVDTHSL